MRLLGIAVAALAALGTLAGCEARLALGSACTYDSECSAALRCAAGRCREECREDRDCNALGDTCIRFAGPGGVCTPPSSALPCALHSDCGPGARCEGSECHRECREDIDCELLGVCTAARICEQPLTTPPAGDGGVLPGECTGGRVRCPATAGCVDLATDPAHCGACGAACPAIETCRGGACFCEAPAEFCGGSCADLDVDELNCGACGAFCDGQCSSGHCCPDPTPTSSSRWCTDACVDLASDDANCGSCGRACAPSDHCFAGDCRPPEDECEGAVAVPLTGPSTTVSFDVGRWSGGAPACDGEVSGYFGFTLDEPAVVAAGVDWTSGVGASVGLLGGGCSSSLVCSAIVCSGNRPLAVAALPAGEHRIAVTFRTTSTPPVAQLRIDVIPLGGAVPVGRIPATGDLVGHLDPAPAGPHCGATGATHAYWRVGCSMPLEASSCAGTLETVLSVGRAGAVRCGANCAGGTTLPAAPGPSDSIDVLFVSARDAAASGDYRITLASR